MKAIPMKHAIILAAFAMLACCALIAGCTSQPQTVITPAETTVATLFATPTPLPPVTPVATLDLVVPLPPEQFVDLQLTKDRTNGEIHLLYNGGKGEVYVQNIRMKVTLSDGTVIDQYMDDGQKPRRGDELVIGGTRGSDRCEVWVTTSNAIYKVMDQPIMSMRY
jgi:hypothetical protein